MAYPMLGASRTGVATPGGWLGPVVDEMDFMDDMDRMDKMEGRMNEPNEKDRAG